MPTQTELILSVAALYTSGKIMKLLQELDANLEATQLIEKLRANWDSFAEDYPEYAKQPNPWKAS